MKELRKKYETPLIGRSLVELEDGVCAGTAASYVVNSEERTVQAEAHADGFDSDTDEGGGVVVVDNEWK